MVELPRLAYLFMSTSCLVLRTCIDRIGRGRGRGASVDAVEQKMVIPGEERHTPSLWMVHKTRGELVTRDDPAGRPTVFQKLARLGLPDTLMPVVRGSSRTFGMPVAYRYMRGRVLDSGVPWCPFMASRFGHDKRGRASQPIGCYYPVLNSRPVVLASGASRCVPRVVHPFMLNVDVFG